MGIFVLSTKKSREIDRIMMDKFLVPGEILMENAGRSIANAIFEKFETITLKEFTVVCGKGNNGGDGFVIARHLLNKGSRVNVFIIAKEEELKGDALFHYKILKNYTKNIMFYDGSDEFFNELKTSILNSDATVDAIFGTGFKGEVKGKYKEIIEIINELSNYTVSVDIPSGIGGDDVTPKSKTHIFADITIALASLKPANIFPPAEYVCGEVYIGDISANQSIISKEADFILTDSSQFLGFFDERELNSHKGTFGHVVIVGGSYGKAGAVALSAMSSQKAGAGLVTVIEPERIYPIVASYYPEIMHFPVKEKNGMIDPGEYSKILKFIEDKDAVVIGPGMGLDKDFREFILNLVNKTNIPFVIDADALNNLKEDVRLLRKENVILTPHPGEFERISGYTKSSIKENRWYKGLDFLKETGINFILKGYRTTIYTNELKEGGYIITAGNPGMATGGSGDSLSGILGAFLARKDRDEYPFTSKIIAGTYIHALSGDLAAEEKGEESLTAEDIANYIPQAIKKVKKEHENL